MSLPEIDTADGSLRRGLRQRGSDATFRGAGIRER